MRILYLSASYVPSRRASSIQVMEMCNAFTSLGHDVTLVSKKCRSREETADIDDHSFYGLPVRFRIRKLPRPASKGGGLLFAAAIAWTLFRERSRCDLVYSRNFIGAWLATRLQMPVLFEAHQLPPGKLSRALYRNFRGASSLLRIVAITDQLYRDLVAHDLLPRKGDAVVALSAVNPDKLRAPLSRIHGHRNGDKLQVGYVGNLYQGRGIDLIIEVARRLGEVTFHIVGGDSKRLAEWTKQDLPDNVVFHGFIKPEKIGEYYFSFDVLLMPHQAQVLGASGTTDIGRWCSPMKLFEYMAAGKAIVASDLPVLGEVLRDGENALIVPAGDVEAWEAAILRLARNGEERRTLGDAARCECLRKYTWTARARTVLQDLPPRFRQRVTGANGASAIIGRGKDAA